MYGVKLFKNGQAQTVIIDDFITCKDRDDDPVPIFTKSNGPELWVILVEKAWAKIHGSYERIEGGLTGQTFTDLTGASTFRIKASAKGAFERILDTDQKKFAISAGAVSDTPEDLEKLGELGFIGQHVYGVLSAKLV